MTPDDFGTVTLGIQTTMSEDEDLHPDLVVEIHDTRPDLPANLKPLFLALNHDAAERERRAEERAEDRAKTREQKAEDRHKVYVENALVEKSAREALAVVVGDLKFRQDRADRMAFPQKAMWALVAAAWLIAASSSGALLLVVSMIGSHQG